MPVRERRVMQGDECGRLRRPGQLGIEPGELLRTELAGRIAGHQAVQADQAQRAERDREAKRPLRREQVEMRER